MSVSGKPSFHRPSTRKGSPRAERLKKATRMLSEKSSCAICHSRWPPTTPPAERWLPSALDMRRTMK
eukprot:scaffold94482_cov58-Phaeocystis_antarctica.AAC.2